MTPCPATSPPPPRPTASYPPHRPRPQGRVLRASLAAALFAATVLPAGRAIAQSPAQAGGDGVDTALAYCTNLADAAADARFARKASRLKELEEDVERRLMALEEKRAQYEDWLERRQRFLDRAQQNLVSIYSGMEPESASAQLAAMDELTAAAIVAKLAPRTASAVLGEMQTDKAARIATIMSGLARESDRSNAG